MYEIVGRYSEIRHDSFCSRVTNRFQAPLHDSTDLSIGIFHCIKEAKGLFELIDSGSWNMVWQLKLARLYRVYDKFEDRGRFPQEKTKGTARLEE